ncbi:MAG: membrane dipeptidase [Pseudomonadota bacterium]
MIPPLPAWFPIHLHRLPPTLANAPLVGAVVSIEWRASALADSYGWTAPWPSAPGERLLAFVQHWRELSSRTPLAQAGMVRFSVEGETDFGDLAILLSLRQAGLVWLDIFRAPKNRYFDRQQGLTEAGLQLLTEMERLGLGLDLTHLPEAALPHVLEAWSGRRLVSHVVCADLLEWSLFQPHNALSDSALLACEAELYGVPFLDDLVALRKTILRAEREAHIETVAKHILHLARLVGVGKVALGPDFFNYKQWEAERIEVDTVAGLEQPEGLAALFSALRAEEMSEEEAEGVFWRNAHRVVSSWGNSETRTK